MELTVNHSNPPLSGFTYDGTSKNCFLKCHPYLDKQRHKNKNKALSLLTLLCINPEPHQQGREFALGAPLNQTINNER